MDPHGLSGRASGLHTPTGIQMSVHISAHGISEPAGPRGPATVPPPTPLHPTGTGTEGQRQEFMFGNVREVQVKSIVRRTGKPWGVGREAAWGSGSCSPMFPAQGPRTGVPAGVPGGTGGVGRNLSHCLSLHSSCLGNLNQKASVQLVKYMLYFFPAKDCTKQREGHVHRVLLPRVIFCSTECAQDGIILIVFESLLN